MLRERADLKFVKLDYEGTDALNRAMMAQAHGHRVQARTELRGPWFGDEALLPRFSNLLAMSSTGARYVYIDVEAYRAACVLVCNPGRHEQRDGGRARAGG